MDEPDFLADPRSAAAPWPPEDRDRGADEPDTSGRSTEGPRGVDAEARRRSLLCIAGWAVAGVLAAVAPFLATFTITVRGATFDAYDGWGRQEVRLHLFAAHGPRWGIALVACAALLLILVVLRAVALLRPIAMVRHRWLPMLAVAAPCFLGGVVLSLVLSVQAYEAQLSAGAFEPTLVVEWGKCVWLSLASLACATSASVLALRPTEQHLGKSLR